MRFWLNYALDRFFNFHLLFDEAYWYMDPTYKGSNFSILYYYTFRSNGLFFEAFTIEFSWTIPLKESPVKLFSWLMLYSRNRIFWVLWKSRFLTVLQFWQNFFNNIHRTPYKMIIMSIKSGLIQGNVICWVLFLLLMCSCSYITDIIKFICSFLRFDLSLSPPSSL